LIAVRFSRRFTRSEWVEDNRYLTPRWAPDIGFDLRLTSETIEGLRRIAEIRLAVRRVSVLIGDCVMKTHGSARRATIAASTAFALLIAVGSQYALALSDFAVRDIRVDVSPLRARAGDPTATWVEQELPRRLAQALAGRLTPKGGTLIVRIDTLTLGPNSGATIHGGSSPDNIGGLATIGGRQWPVRATSTYYSSPIDQTMIDQSNHYRVSQLVQALTYWLSGDP
jgi:hypothetical protein